MALYAGIDWQGNNGYYGILDEQDRRVFKKRLPNDLTVVRAALKPFQPELQGVVVESPYNWYWLVDGLMEQEYPMHLFAVMLAVIFNGAGRAREDPFSMN